MKIVNDQLIKKWEALKLKAYLPTPNDVWTIGWGHTHSAKQGQVITRAQAQKLFEQDVAWVEAALTKYVKVPLNQNQYDALASWIFNVGEGAFRKSTLLRKLNAKDYEGAARELPRWNKQKGKVLRGLTKRRAQEMEYFLSTATLVKTITNPKPDNVPSLKPLTASKEMAGGLTAVVGGAVATLAPAVGGLSPEAQVRIVDALPVLLIIVGVAFVANRLYARYKAQR